MPSDNVINVNFKTKKVYNPDRIEEKVINENLTLSQATQDYFKIREREDNVSMETMSLGEINEKYLKWNDEFSSKYGGLPFREPQKSVDVEWIPWEWKKNPLLNY